MIGIGSDHGGFELKQHIIKYLSERNIEYKDYGAYSFDPLDDYPIFVEKVCKAIQEGICDKGILICGNGIGVSIAANKFKGIRAGLCGDTYTARTSREHSDTNVLALGGRVIGKELALDIVDVWLNAEFKGGKYKKRIEQISKFETNCK